MNKHIHVILPKKLVDKTKQQAKRERRTMTEVIRQALTEYVIDRKEEN